MEPLIIYHDCPRGNTDPTRFRRVIWQGVPFDIAVMCEGCGKIIFGTPENDENRDECS